MRELAAGFDLSSPPQLEKNIRDFRRRAHTRFTADNFSEALPFDCLEIEVLGEQLRALQACGA